MIGCKGISCHIALRWMSRCFTDGRSILVQVMARCRMVASHYLSHRCPRSQPLYGLTRPWLVNFMTYGAFNLVERINAKEISCTNWKYKIEQRYGYTYPSRRRVDIVAIFLDLDVAFMLVSTIDMCQCIIQWNATRVNLVTRYIIKDIVRYSWRWLKRYHR